jgi:phage terminase Nu1 subunit (DNA packaging protein)
VPGQDAAVTIESAAELMDIDVRSIRQWSAIGSLRIERRGDAELVDLAKVRALMRSGLASNGRRERRRGALQGLLREAKAVDPQSVAGLQELARERAAAG